MYKIIFISLLLLGCKSANVTNDAIVKIHNDYVLLNGVSIESIEILSREVSQFQNIYIEDHACTEHEKSMEVINTISKNSQAQLHLTVYGFEDVEFCK